MPDLKNKAPKSKYSKEVAEQAKEIIACGDNYTELAKKLGIGRRTLYYWRKHNPGFEEKLAQGDEIFWTWMGIRLIEQAANGLSKIEIAAFFGVSYYTLLDWVKNEEKLKPFWDIAYPKSFSWWWQQAREVINDPKKSKSAAIMIIFSMKKIFGLFDAVEMDDLLGDTGVSKEEMVKVEYRLKKIVEIEMRQSRTMPAEEGKKTLELEDKSGE
jgi:hypothetical protein